jgi:PAS domain-containing protein
MVQSGEPLIVPIQQLPGLGDLTATDWIVPPLVLIHAEGRVIGFIHIDSAQPNTFNVVHVERLQAFANHASIAVQNARLFQAVQRHASDLEQRVAQRTADLSETNRQLVEQIQERERAEQALAGSATPRTLIDHLPDDIYVKDTQSRFLLITGQPYGPGRSASRRRDRQTDLTSRDAGRTAFRQNSRLWRRVRRSPTTITCMRTSPASGAGCCSPKSLCGTGRQIKGLVGINHDITELKRAEEQLLQVITSAA